MNTLRHLILSAASLTAGTVLAAAPGTSPLVVVRDAGGVSAIRYYEPLSLEAHTATRPLPGTSAPPVSADRRERPLDLFPVHSARLSPGPAAARTLDIPGLTPVFLIGDDAVSRRWLSHRVAELRALHAVGFVVEVSSRDAFESLQRLAPGLTLSPVSGDDLAARLKIEHYPVLVTSTRLGP
jgi:integrating conjugative element protein (TIGR03765 family)